MILPGFSYKALGEKYVDGSQLLAQERFSARQKKVGNQGNSLDI